MAAVVEARVNWIVLNRGADLYFEGENVFVPFGSVAAKELADVLAAIGCDRIVVEYRTTSDPKRQTKDRTMYTRRLAGLTGWTRTEWATKVIRGYAQPDRMECVLTRSTTEPM